MSFVMCNLMSAEFRAREFLARYVELVPVDPNEVHHGIYSPTRLVDCEIFMLQFPSSQGVGSGKYLAVPKDGSDPFYIGEIGE